MLDPFLGQIALFPYQGEDPPYGWLDCLGQYVPIKQYTALYGLIGTAYGGDGQTYFCLPDLRGRAAVGFGPSAGGKTYPIGQRDGQEYVTVTSDTMPSHHHDVTATTQQGTTNTPEGKLLAQVSLISPQGGPKGNIYNPSRANVQMSGSSVPPRGGAGGAGPTEAHNNMQPSLVLRYCICVDGILPTSS